jgi:hypothetical protein
MEPFSLLDRQTWLKTILSWLVFLLFTFAFLPFLEEYGKRTARDLISVGTAPTMFWVVQRLTFHTYQSQVVHFFQLVAHTLAPAITCLLLAQIEIDRYQPNRRLLNLAVRFAAHYLLLLMPLWEAWQLHALFNLLVYWFDPALLLKVDESRPLGFYHGVQTIPDVCCLTAGVKEKPTQEGFHVTWGPAECVAKFGSKHHWFVKWPDSFIPYVGTVYRTCSCNERISLCGRVGQDTPVQHGVNKHIALLEWQLLTDDVLGHMQTLIQSVLVATPWRYWCGKFPPGKREMYNEFRSNCDDVTSTTASSFIKREVHLVENECYDEKDPRMIQAPPPVKAAICGPWLHKLSKNFRRDVRPRKARGKFVPASLLEGRQVVYTSGLSAESVGKAFAQAVSTIQSLCEPGENVIVFESDQSRFDLHLIEGPFRFLDAFYKGKIPERIRKLLQRDVVKGRTKLNTWYKILATMQSGESDTAVADSLINTAMYFYTFLTGGKWIVIICGDDSLCITTDAYLRNIGGVARIKRTYDDLGMEVECIVRYNVELAEFCSGRMYPVGLSYVLMPKIGKLVTKIGIDSVDRVGKNQLAWLRSIGKTLENFGLIDPICATLAKRILQYCGVGKMLDTSNPYKFNVEWKHESIDWPGVLRYYDLHYNMDRAAIEGVIAVLDRDFTPGTAYESAWLCEMVRIDLA